MKIISVDNFDRENPGNSDDRLVLSGCVDKLFAERIVKALNEEDGDTSNRFYKLVEDSYMLVKYEA